MKNITAEDILREYIDFDDINGNDTVELLPLTIADIMIQFAAIHVEAALYIASERADLTDNGRFPYVDKGSILTSYPLSNIK